MALEPVRCNFEDIERLRDLGVKTFSISASGYRLTFFEPEAQASGKDEPAPPDNSMPTRAEVAEMRRRIEMPPEGSG